MSDPKTYTDDFAKFADRINRIEASIRNLRVPTDGQFTQTVKKILALFDSLDQQVADSISKNSYDKATIDSKLQDWNWGTLTPGRGGTGTTATTTSSPKANGEPDGSSRTAPSAPRNQAAKSRPISPMQTNSSPSRPCAKSNGRSSATSRISTPTTTAPCHESA